MQRPFRAHGGSGIFYPELTLGAVIFRAFGTKTKQRGQVSPHRRCAKFMLRNFDPAGHHPPKGDNVGFKVSFRAIAAH